MPLLLDLRDSTRPCYGYCRRRRDDYTFSLRLRSTAHDSSPETIIQTASLVLSVCCRDVGRWERTISSSMWPGGGVSGRTVCCPLYTEMSRLLPVIGEFGGSSVTRSSTYVSASARWSDEDKLTASVGPISVPASETRSEEFSGSATGES